jgi:hypothetical protein
MGLFNRFNVQGMLNDPYWQQAVAIAERQPMHRFGLLQESRKRTENDRLYQEAQQRRWEEQAAMERAEYERAQQKEQQRDQALQNIADMHRPLPPGQQGPSLPTSQSSFMESMLTSGNPALMSLALQGLPNQPSNVREWQYFDALSPEDQDKYMDLRRGGYGFDVGGVPHYRTPSGDLAPLAQPEAVVENVGNIAEEKATRTAEAERGASQVAAADLAKEARHYVQEARELVKGMNDMQLGPLAARLPNLSGESQLLNNKLNNLIGNVRDKLGPGILSDPDILLLKSMIPHMAMDKGPLLKALDSFEAELIRRIEKGERQTQKTYKPNDPAGLR